MSVDIGGTFTDFVYIDNKKVLKSFKLPSVPEDPALSIKKGLELLPHNPANFLHGTTVATNTILQRTGSRTAFITTSGFRDILHIGRQTRPSLYDFSITRKEPLVTESLCFEVNERVDTNGVILKRVETSQLKTLSKHLKKAKVEAAGVCFLFSYLNNYNERAVGKHIGTELNIPVTLSSELLPEFREFERASTTVMNAYLQNSVGKYLSNLRGVMKKVGIKEYYVMQSNGGVALSRFVEKTPVRTLLSGPAAGVAAAASLGRAIGEANLITFDMGGTSTDVAAILDNEVLWTPDGVVDSLPLKIPMVKIETIGAGGGSIAQLDPGGALTVGPASAGAMPGPVCYGKGGTDITVTDSNLLLGLIDPAFFLGGEFKLDQRTTRKQAGNFAKKAGYGVKKLAEGIRRVVEANMLRAVKKVTVEKGLEPNDFALVAFGGAGPIHAAAIASELGIPKVIIPVSPGTFSAFGLLVSEIKLDFTKTNLLSLDSEKYKSKIQSILTLHHKAAKQALKTQNIHEKNAVYSSSLDMRYRGQSYEVNVPLDNTISKTINLFHSLHNKMFGYSMPDASVECVNVRLEVRAERGNGKHNFKSLLKGKPKGPNIKKPQAMKERTILIDGTNLKTPIYDRLKLVSGMELRGPAVAADSGSTALVLPGMTAVIDDHGNMIIATGR